MDQAIGYKDVRGMEIEGSAMQVGHDAPRFLNE
jgi:hypothetical protein